MRSIVLFIVIAIGVTGCSTKSELKKYKAKNCNTLFDFDQVDHFYYDIDNDKMSQLWDEKFVQPGDEQLAEVIARPLSKDLSDSASMKNIQELGFTKVLLSPPQLQEVANIFCVRHVTKAHSLKINNCVPVWRDILVFRNEGSIVGIAKICFTCDQLAIAGTNQQVTFGYYQEYGRLAKTLKRPHAG